MARWPVCGASPGLSADLASWHDDPEILHDAVERLHAARSALARELGAGVRARRGDAAERVAWSSLLERPRVCERASASELVRASRASRRRLRHPRATPVAAPTRVLGPQPPLAAPTGAWPARSLAGCTPLARPRSSAPRRLFGATLRGGSDAAPSDKGAEGFMTDYNRKSVGGGSERRVGEPVPSGSAPNADPRRRVRGETETPYETRSCGRCDDSRDVRAVHSARPVAFRSATRSARAPRRRGTSKRRNDAEEDFSSVFLSVAKRSDASKRACHVLSFFVDREGVENGDEGFGRHASQTTVVAGCLDGREIRISSRRTNGCCDGSHEAIVAFGDAPRASWVAVAERRTVKEIPKQTELGVRVYALDESESESETGEVFLPTPFAPTRLAASSAGLLVACGARGVSATCARRRHPRGTKGGANVA